MADKGKVDETRPSTPFTAAGIPIAVSSPMSTTLHDHAERYECHRDGCDSHRTTESSVGGSYCSRECAAAARGQDFLQHLTHDHRFCSSCYRARKVVFRPTETDVPRLREKALVVRESFVGYETLTEFSSHGDYGVECNCGVVDHQTAESLCRDGEPYEWYLKLAVQQLRKEGQHEYRFDLEVFADAVWAGDDFAVAVGRALEQ